jgi:hypothetical protein
MPHNVYGSLLISLFILSGCHRLEAQVGKAVSRMEEGKWSAAEPILIKAISKDSLDVEARLQYSRFFFAAGNPKYNLDSARAHAIESGRVYATLQERQRERLSKSGVDSAAIVALRQDIDSVAFEAAKKENTVAAYERFIRGFAGASQVTMSKELMYEVAFLEALRLNTPKGFSDYLVRFPDSRRVGEASERYELLVFQETTRDGKLSSFRRFVEAYPQSTHCGEAERRIFEMSTATGVPDSFRQFLTQYPGSAYADRARNILYYLNHEPGAARFVSDSLTRLDKLNAGYWVPFFKNGLYGFMDENGNEAMPPRFAKIDSSYLCGNIREDVVLTSDGLFSRGGHKLLSSSSRQVVHLGLGFIFAGGDDCGAVVHKSGFTVGPSCAADARIVSEQFIAISEKGKWKLYGFNGVVLSNSEYEDVTFEDNIIILSRSGKKLLTTTRQWMAASEGNAVDATLVFDEVRAWGDGNLVVRNGALEGVINQDLEFVIALDRQTLAKTSSGFVRSKDGKKLVAGTIPELERQPFDNIIDYGDWMVLVNDKKSMIYRASTKTVAGRNLDSVWLRSNIPFASRNDSLIVFGLTGKPAMFDSKSPLTFLKSRDTLVYYWVQDTKTRSVFDALGNRKLFSAEFEDVEAVGGGLFIIKQKNKKGQIKLGLVSGQGTVVLPSEYDAIIPTSGRYLSLLKDKLFGQYDLSRKLLIQAAYERNLFAYSDRYLVAYKGGYGFVNTKEEPVSAFEFDEIRYWNDTSAWVRKNLTWSIYSIKDKATKLARVRNFQVLSDTNGEKIVRIQQENHFGIASSVHGVIIPATFSEVLNVGSDEKPFYFTDKRVEEAEIDVVIYYDHRGKLIRKQIYESDEYDKIYCEED